MDIRVDLTNSGIDAGAIAGRRARAAEEFARLHSGELDFTGWVAYPNRITEDEIAAFEKAADEIAASSSYLLVLGIGGSYMGAKAVLDLLSPEKPKCKVVFAGYNFSGLGFRKIMEEIGDDDYSVCVISKSGSTAETRIAYAIVREQLETKYGKEEADARTWVISDLGSPLWKEGEEKGHKLFAMPEGVGGRYSVFTSVGLLPIACAGVDIRALLKGAADCEEALEASCAHKEGKSGSRGDAFDYAIARQEHREKGKAIEVFEFYDPYFDYLGEWLKQLFGESEGKEGIGLFPASLMFSRDLHSMGQFLQQGNQCFFETMVTAEKESVSIQVPALAGELYGGKALDDINRCAVKGVTEAHVNAGVPVISVTIPEVGPEAIGQLLYWFEMQCAVSALLQEVNPFDQPGVEDYKSSMRKHIAEL